MFFLKWKAYLSSHAIFLPGRELRSAYLVGAVRGQKQLTAELRSVYSDAVTHVGLLDTVGKSFSWTTLSTPSEEYILSNMSHC